MPIASSAPAGPPGAVFAVPGSQPVEAMPGLGSLAEVALALIVVLALIMAVAWAVRRMRAAGTDGDAIRVVAETALGAKERAVLLQVHGRQLLVGVGAGSVTTLHVFGADEATQVAGAAPATTPDRPSFQALLRRSLRL